MEIKIEAVTIQLTLSVVMHEKLEKAAHRQGKKTAQFARELLEQRMDERGYLKGY